ncbi:MAG: hypothetical protein ACK40V_07665 [Anaerolineales bacterium]
MKTIFYFTTFIFLFALIINPQRASYAQGGCFDSAGAPIPCPATDAGIERTKTF